MGTILSQDGLIVIKPLWVEVLANGFIFAKVDTHDSVLLGKYKNTERAKEVLRDMFQTSYYEMPLE